MEKKSSSAAHELNRATVHRMYRIFERIRCGALPNKRKLATEMEVNQRTIQRDIEFMIDTWQFPIEYDRRKGGFYFTGPVASFPLISLTEGELFAIFVGEKALEQMVGTPFEAPLRNTFKKFAARLSNEMSFEWSELQHGISFKSIEVNPVDAGMFQELGLAVRRSTAIEFDYKKLGATKFERRQLQPYELVCVNHQWYLFGHDLMRREIRKFVLPRMRNLKTTAHRFTKPKSFSAKKHLENSFGVFSGEKIETITIQFDQFASQLVREQKWHSSQAIREMKSGQIQLTLSLGSFEEVERWILSWGHHARVLSPPLLAERVKLALKRTLAQY
jgi:predicted DNA-binding transcriptional regulator YafY